MTLFFVIDKRENRESSIKILKSLRICKQMRITHKGQLVELKITILQIVDKM